MHASGYFRDVATLVERLGYPSDAKLLIINCDDLGSSHAAHVAIYWGFDVSHLDSHMATLQLRPEFFDVYLELAVDFSLPIRLSGASSEGPIGFPFRRLAAEEGVVFPDHLVVVNTVGTRRALERALLDLRPGVTEVYAHPAVDTGELRALSSDWSAR